MSMNDGFKDCLTRTVTASTRPCLGEVNEIIYSDNQLHNADCLDLGSSSTSHMMNSKYYGSEVSKKLTYEILKRYTQVDPLFIFDNNDEKIDEISPKPIDSKEKKSDDSSNVSSLHRKKSTGVQYEVASETEVHSYHYSRSNSVCNVEVPSRFTSGETGLNHTSLHNIEEKKKAEKMTYCCPVTSNFYNEEFYFKTAERNRRLQKLVKKMTIAREREKQENAWNNYINELRHKHGYHDTASKIPIPFLSHEKSSPGLIEDFYRTNFKCQKSNHCENLLKDFYEPCTSTQTNYYERLNSEYYGSMNPPYINIPVKTTESFTKSPDPRLILKRDRSNQCESAYYSHHIAKNVYDNTILVDTQYSQSGVNSKRTSKSTVVYKRKSPRILKNSSIQTHLKLLPLKKEESVENVTYMYDKVAENVFKIKNLVDVKQEQRQDSLDSIESKLDVLIQSVNTLIAEVRTKPVSRNSSLAYNNRMSISRSVDAVRVAESFHGSSFNSASKITLGYNVPKMLHSSGVSKLDNIIVEEMNKSDEVKRDIENILNGDVKKSCAVQIISDNIPTRDCSTEVTNSLSKTEVSSAEEIQRNFSEDHRMTIAVNTDPLGLQALLRISKETVKNVLSFMQNFSYQNLLQLPLPRENGTPFACSVCGAMFMTPSQLTEHIHSHVRNRYCCVCRHLTGIQPENPRRTFFCEFCGKPFTRAYCCELHQQTCAKRLGRLRDVTSSLVLLR